MNEMLAGATPSLTPVALLIALLLTLVVGLLLGWLVAASHPVEAPLATV